MDTVQVQLTSFHNVNFNVLVDTETTPEEWGELSYQEQNNVLVEILFNNVEVTVLDD